MTTSAARLLILLLLAGGVLLGAGPMRRLIVARPGWVLGAIVLLDTGLLLWAMTPFVPDGWDESQFLSQAHRLLGADLENRWIRTPLPVLAIAASPLHPALPGIVGKQLATVFAYHLARPVGVGLAVYAALLTSVTSALAANTCQVVSEPYGAAALAGFALACAAGGPLGLFAGATLGFLSRWQLLWSLPIAAFLTWRRRGWRTTVGWTLLAAGVAGVAVWLTEADPLRAFLQERQRDHTLSERLGYYLAPRVGLGIGIAALGCAVLGAVAVLRDRERDPRLAASLWLFVVFVAGVLSIGVITRRFLAPAVPLACVLAAAGIRFMSDRWPRLRRPWLASVALAALAVTTAVPVPHPRSREHKLGTPQAEVCADLAHLQAVIAGAVLYSDVDTMTMEAVMGRRCRAVGDGHSAPMPAAIPRTEIPVGSLYLTFDAADREVLWSSRRLALVRW